MQHSSEMIVVAGKVKHGAAQHYVREVVRKGHHFYGFYTKIVGRKRRRKRGRQAARVFHCLPIHVRPEYFVSVSQQVNQVTARAAPCLEDPPSRRDPAAQKLVEQVNIDLAELLLKR